MAYKELIKNFNNIREYMREFYVYGFRTRNEYTVKSARSYDNERRRVDCWLGDYMKFSRTDRGRSVFISVDSRKIESNPFYNAFKTKSFTDKDIMLYFYILDSLNSNGELGIAEIMAEIEVKLARFNELLPDESTVRKKLKEYEEIGLIDSRLCGRARVYRLSDTEYELRDMFDAMSFFSEISPLGVVGSYIKDIHNLTGNDTLRFKHHYILQALDTEIIYTAMNAIAEARNIDVEVRGKKSKEGRRLHVLPLKIYISVQTGRFYLCAWDYAYGEVIQLRTNNIKNISIEEFADTASMETAQAAYATYSNHAWGVSVNTKTVEHLEFTVNVNEGEQYIISRLNRESRCAEVTQEGEGRYRVIADVCDAEEMLPWIRTFIGRITDLSCDNEQLRKKFYDDLAATYALYGGDNNAV